MGAIKYILTAFLFSAISMSVHAQDTTHKFNRYDSLRGYLNPARSCYKVTFYDLNITVNPDKKEISGSNTIHFKALKDMDSMQVDLFKNMVVDSIMLEVYDLLFIPSHNHPRENRKQDTSYFIKVNCTRDSNSIFVHFPYSPLAKKHSWKIQIFYHGHPTEATNPPWDGGFVWKNDSNGKPWVTVACEGVGASLWWPCKDHLSDKPDSMRITCAMPAGLFCKANGRFRKFRNVPGPDNYISYEWFVSYPINTYDVTINIGDYTHLLYLYYSKVVDELDLNLYFLQYHAQQAEDHIREVYDMMQCYEKYFGPYPFKRDGYSLVETPYWGMEHQSAIAYGNNFKLNEYGFDFILIHETAHEWFGNSLSCNDQSEMWLNESFATYAEALYVEYSQGYKKSVQYLLEQKQQIVNKVPMIGPRDVNAYQRSDNDIYYKGAWMLHTLRTMINNDSLWFKIIHNYATKNAYSIVTTDTFINLVNRMTGKDYRPFFIQYLTKRQPPKLVYTLEQIGNDVRFTGHVQADVDGLEMPLKVEMEDGHIVPTKLTSKEDKIIFQNTKLSQIHVDDLLFIVQKVKE